MENTCEFESSSSNTKQDFKGQNLLHLFGFDFDLHAICLSVKQWEQSNIRSKNFLVSICNSLDITLFLEPTS